MEPMKYTVKYVYDDVTPDGVVRFSTTSRSLVVPNKDHILNLPAQPDKDFLVVDVRHRISNDLHEVHIHAVHEPKKPKPSAPPIDTTK